MHPAFRVLRLIVVPIRLRDDLAGLRHERLFVADHGALDLVPDGGRLDEDGRVVCEGGIESRPELVLARYLRDPEARSEPRGLHELRHVHGPRSVEHRFRSGQPFALAHDLVTDLRHARFRHQALEGRLVHAHGGGEHPGAYVSDVHALEQPLNGSVLPERAMEDGKDDVGVQKPGAGDDPERTVGSAGLVAVPNASGIERSPCPLGSDHDWKAVVAAGLETVEHRPRRLERDVVLARPPAGKHTLQPHLARAESRGPSAPIDPLAHSPLPQSSGSPPPLHLRSLR